MIPRLAKHDSFLEDKLDRTGLKTVNNDVIRYGTSAKPLKNQNENLKIFNNQKY